MAINTALLIAAPMFQDYLVDKDTGLPLSGGTITMYQDNSRTTLKNWYYQSGSPGAYTYITLPNPMTLTAVGTIADNNGNDTIPFYYPFSEVDNSTPQPYYAVVTNQNGEQQFVRQNYPFINSSGGVTPGGSGTTIVNYIANNVFWRQFGAYNASTGQYVISSTTINTTLDPLTGTPNIVISPSQHDGFSQPDTRFIKNTADATDTLTFIPFPLGNPTGQTLTNDVTPEYYLNVNCTVPGTETLKYVQFPISLHIKTLESQTGCISIWTQNAGGSANDTLTLSILQYTGTGATASSVTTVIKSITTTSAWTKTVVPFTFPSASGQSTSTLGQGLDDALYLQIGYPVAVSASINMTKPSIYLNTTAPTNDFQTYDQIDTIINSPRTGDIRTSLSDYYSFGWVPLNGGTIGNVSSNASSRASNDTFRLYSLIWQSFNLFNLGTTNILAQMFSSAGSAVTYGASAIADFNANKAISLSNTMGKVILGTVPLKTLLAPYSATFTVTNAGGLLITAVNGMNIFTGMPVIFTGNSLPSTVTTNTVYYVSAFSPANPTQFYIATTFANAIAGIFVSYAAGSGTVMAAFKGTYEGEYAHTQLGIELAAHSHSVPSTNVSDSFGTLFGAASGSGISEVLRGAIDNGTPGTQWFTGATNTGTAGSSSAFNITQPGIFLNMYMKL